MAASVAVTAGAAALSVGRTPAEAALIATAASITTLAGGWIRERSKRRWVEFVREYVCGAEAADPQLVEARLHAAGEDPIVQEVVVETARAIDEALADIVVPVLARLTREYVSTQRRADAKFRGMRRLLSDLSEDEFVAFRDLVLRVSALRFAREPRIFQLVYHRFEPDPHGQLHGIGTPDEGDASEERIAMGQFSMCLRVFHLLRVNHLGIDAVGRVGVAGPLGIGLDLDQVRWIRALVE